MKINIGTRSSRLALKQTEMAAAAILSKCPDIEIEVIHITTSGDRIKDMPLSAIGGKGVFVSEIEKALLNGDIDMAVHSAKDMPVRPADGLAVTGVLAAGDSRDCIISMKNHSLEGKITVGTGSLRRRISISALYPMAEFADIRGNIDTRLAKLEQGLYDCIILAAAGIQRLGTDTEKYDIRPLPAEISLPAPCQGIIALETLSEGFAAETAKKISCGETFLRFETERYAMELMGADCTLPAGAYSYIENGIIHLTVSADGIKKAQGSAPAAHRFLLAKELVESL